MARPLCFWILFGALFALLPAGASGHAIGVSTGEYRVDGNVVATKIVFARSELIRSFPALDIDSDGALSNFEVERSAGIWKRLTDDVKVTAGALSCDAASTQEVLTSQDGVQINALFRCPSSNERVSVRVAFFRDLTPGHRHLATVNSRLLVLFEANPDFQMDAHAASSSVSAGSFLWMGLQHILTGYDHLVFLLGLILVGRSLRPLLLVVSMFTLGHSITLAITVLSGWTPPPGVVEPLIALSIVYIGVENFFIQDIGKRWRITLPFGLIHGLGFGGALRAVALSPRQIPVALVGFNLGVEAGQIAILALLLPAVLWMRQQTWFETGVLRRVSAAIVVAGSVWFVLRMA